MRAIEALAPAKVNLTLHVTGLRADGYHLLDSLVVFADKGDLVTVQPGEDLTLAVTGPRAEGVPEGPENLVIRAARLLDPVRGAEIALDKHLPASAGIGGGSSDAAATLRALSALWGLPLPRTAATLGADVPMCLDPRAQRVGGAGEVCLPVEGLPALPAVLVNPGAPVATPEVFARLRDKTNPPMPEMLPRLRDVADAAAWLATQRNDLAAPAEALAPAIAEVRAALGTARLVRMSGSGATCFGLYDTPDAARRAATDIARLRRDWWVEAVLLNPQADRSPASSW